MRWTAVVVLGSALAIGSAARAQAMQDGIEAWQRGDYEAAVKVWRPLAAKGDGDAAFDLAQAYKLGRGVPTDMAQAKQLYGQAARAGHVEGGANYGLLLFQDGDRKAALPWIAKAADAGDPRAQYVLGTALFNGDLMTRDWPRGYAMMTRAAAAGLPQATTSLAQMDRYLSADDRQKGAAIATTLAQRPVPPMGKQLVTGGGAKAAPVTVAAATPPPVAAPVATPKAPAPPRPPRAKPVATPPPAVAATGGRWQVQLGAYGNEAAARTAWGGVSRKLPGLSPRYEKAGAVVRLRVAGLADKAAAKRACAAVAPAPCFPVAP